MTAYVIAQVRPTGDADELAEYRAKVVATLTPYGGRYLVRGGDLAVLEGEAADGQVVVVEFPDAAAAQAWNASPEYQAIAPLRIRNTESRRWIVEGIGIEG